MADSDTTRAVIEAARRMAKIRKDVARRKAAKDESGIPWEMCANKADLALIDALAQYDKEAKDE